MEIVKYTKICIVVMLTQSLMYCCEGVLNDDFPPDSHIALNQFTESLINSETSYANRDISKYVRNVVIFISNTNNFLKITRNINSAELNSTLMLPDLRAPFANLSKAIKQNSYVLQDTLTKPQLASLENKLSGIPMAINRCSSMFLSFLENPRSHYRTIQLVNCYDQTKFVKTVGQTLYSDINQPGGETIFTNLISENGHCDGQQLLQIYWYLLGLYTEGCLILSMAETIKFNASASLFREECIKNITAAQNTRVNLFEICRKESCDKIRNNLQILASTNDTQELNSQIKEIYPWFHFLILRFRKGADPHEQFIGNTLNSLKIPDTTQTGPQLFLWSTRISSFEDRDTLSYTYGVEFDSPSLVSVVDNMNMKSVISSVNRTKISGLVEYPKTYKCRMTLGETISDSCAGNDCQISISKRNLYTMVAFLVILTFTTFIFIFLFLFVMKKHYPDKFTSFTLSNAT